jgi:hypothetical protein
MFRPERPYALPGQEPNQPALFAIAGLSEQFRPCPSEFAREFAPIFEEMRAAIDHS